MPTPPRLRWRSAGVLPPAHLSTYFRFSVRPTVGSKRQASHGKRVLQQDSPDKAAVNQGKSLSCVRTPSIEGS
jgi:hypothetical protein